MLTDKDITEIMDRGDVVEGNRFLPYAYARAVIAAYEKKLRENKPFAWHSPTDGLSYENHYSDNQPLFEHPAPIPAEQIAEIKRKERERCAVVCERLISGDGICADNEVWIHDCAEAIRSLEG